MAHRIVTKNKDDIQYAGFNLSCNVDVYKFLRSQIKGIGGTLSKIVTDEIIQGLVDDNKDALVDWMNQNLDDAEEIFIEEASLSRWSGNMIDNSVCGISGTLPEMRGNTLFMDVRVGVNTNEIKNVANWTTRTAKKMKRNSTGVIYEYNGYRMHYPPVDYSGYLERGIAGGKKRPIPNQLAWKGFVERAEERFWA